VVVAEVNSFVGAAEASDDITMLALRRLTGSFA
jgi:serine phosphatase RsbU (regulator of sigma subunit)